MYTNKSVKINFEKRIIITFLIILLSLVFFSQSMMAITAEEIINKRDENEYIESAKIEAKMIITNAGREMTKEMISVSKGEDAFVEFTNPRDRGTKYLKKGDNLWMFFPDAEDIVKISGHMMNQGMMGSDFSYQDIMESTKMTELYNFKLIGEGEYNNRSCYILEATAVEGKEVSYYKRKIWIDTERFIALKEELYAQSGRLLKVSEVTEVGEFEGRYYPVRNIMENKLRENTSTEFIVEKIEFNPEIDESIFTLENLQ